MERATAVVLLRPPMVVPKWADGAFICPPLGLAYLAAALRRADIDVRCVDSVGEAPFQRVLLDGSDLMTFGLTTPEIVRKVGACDVLGISLMFSKDWPISKSIIRAIRRENPDAVIVCGGEHVSAIPEFCLDDCPEIDVCVVGEGEETLVQLIRALEEKRPLEGVAGVVCRLGDGPVRGPKRARIADLDAIPWPAWDLLPLETYLANGLGYGVEPGRSVPLLASRGCPFECTFCSNPQMWTTKWQARDPEDVVREMQDAMDRYGVRNFDFFDLTTIVRKDWIMRFCGLLIERGLNVAWQMPAGTRSEALDAEALALMYRSGAKFLAYAPESGSETTLKLIKKRIRPERMKESMRAALKIGFSVKLNMIMGLPNETRREIFETLVFLKDAAVLGVHDVYIACFSPYPGSELFDELYHSGKVRDLNDGGRIRTMDDAYFLRLANYSDLRYAYSYSPSLSNAELTLYRLGGMLFFYALSYALHPQRLFRTLWNLVVGREESRLDVGLAQLRDRLLLRKISAGRAS